MGISGATQQQARVKARERRVALEHDRFARDRRVQAAVAAAGVAGGDCEDAWALVRAAEVRLGLALSAIIADGVSAGGAARLCNLSCGQVRRLMRAAEDSHSSAAGRRESGAGPGGAPQQAPIGALDPPRDKPPAPGSGPGSPEQPDVLAHPR